jgi:uncharacterized membrane protein YhaH (DUF805 family)
MNLKKFLGFLFSWKGEIGRSAYAFTGLALFLLKWNLDRLFSFLVQSENYPTPFFYLLPETDFTSTADPAEVILPIFGLALPFIYIGIVLTVKRLRSLGWPIYSSVLFFVPFINFLFFFLLSILPKSSPTAEINEDKKKKHGWLDRFLPRGKVACAALVSVLFATLGTLFVSLSLHAEIGQEKKICWLTLCHGTYLCRNLRTSRKTQGKNLHWGCPTDACLFLSPFACLGHRRNPLPVHGCSHCITFGRSGGMGWSPNPKPPDSPQPLPRSLCRHFSSYGLRGKFPSRSASFRCSVRSDDSRSPRKSMDQCRHLF